VWEKELLRECKTLHLTETLQVESHDRWQCQPDPATDYAVRDAYQILTSHDSVTLGATEDIL
jgi:hypothetical protein